MAEVLTLEGTEELIKQLRKLSTQYPSMQNDMKKILRECVKEARKYVAQAAKGALPNDPRKAARAVRSAVWRKYLGGNVNILQSRKVNNKMSTYHAPRTLKPGQRGGNRRLRSDRTNDIDSYYGTDRGFILRFVNAGAGLKNERPTKYGRRGHIEPRNWFAPAAEQGMQQAAEMFSLLVDRAINYVWNENKE